MLRDNDTYSSSVYEGIMGLVMGKTILQMDEPEHRLHRALVSPTFRSKVLERWEGDLVQRVVDELLDDFAADGSADLVQQLTFHFPVQVIAEILGLPRADFPRFQRWAIEITSVAANWDRGVAASEALRDYFAGVVEERRVRPADDLISDLLAVEVDGRRPRRRGDLLVPPSAAAGRGRDHLPGLGQPPLRAAHQPRPAAGRA